MKQNETIQKTPEGGLDVALPPELGNPLRAHLAWEAFRYQVGQQIFCPSCKQVLDCNNAVGVDLVGETSGKLFYSKAFCGKCADTKLHFEKARLAAEAKMKEPARIDKIDGRLFDEDGEPLVIPGLDKGTGLQTFYSYQKHPGKDAGWKAVQGYPVTIPTMGDEFVGWKFFVYESEPGDKPGPGTWFMVETQTGMAVGSGATAEQAAMVGCKHCLDAGLETVEKRVAEELAEDGRTPRPQ